MNESVTILPKAQTTMAAGNTLIADKSTTDSLQETKILPVQCKLQIGAPDDPLEDEADAMADKVMRMPEPNFIQRKCAHCEEEEKVQRKPLASFIQKKSATNNSITSDAISNRIQSTKGSGNPMPETTKNFMENRFRADFSNVNIHTGNYASQLSNQLNAQAFTVGNDIYFNEGKYTPESSGGKHLLAHELTHTLQQNSIEPKPHLKKIQRQTIQQRSGNLVGVGTSQNIREEVLQTLDRLHELWSITNAAYAADYPVISSLAVGSRVPITQMRNLIAAIVQNEQPAIHPIVARNFLAIALTNTVGRLMVNQKNDVLMLQGILYAQNLLLPADYFTERSAVNALATATVPDNMISKTLVALTDLKQRIAGGRMGWSPVHADERRFGPSDDKFGARTFNFGIFSIFIPSAVSPVANNVHIFFSPGYVQGESGLNAVLHHGLRGASDSSRWILIGVPGAEPGFVSISTQNILDCLSFVGRGTRLDNLRLSAHSRGYRGLRETIRRRLINTSLVDMIVIFDANYGDVASTLSRSGISPSKIFAYDVGTGTLGVTGSVTHHLNANCMRAIGYSRLIQDAMITKPGLVIPAAIQNQLLTLPSRGLFTTQSPAPGTMVNINGFCRTNTAAISAIIRNENNAIIGLKTFLDANDLGRLGSPFSAGIYSHHFFVTELAHEVTDN